MDLPFAGVLASLALFPIIAPHFWHRRYGLVALFWALAFLLPFAARFGAGVAVHELAHVVLLEYLPFVILVGSLFVIAGYLSAARCMAALFSMVHCCLSAWCLRALPEPQARP